MRWFRCLALVVAIGTTSCGSPRPFEPSEQLECGLDRFVVKDVFTDIQTVSQVRTAPSRTPAESSVTFNVLALSAGGELGVFGAGFLRGWQSAGDSARPVARSDIQVVTGVSAGALLATHAFLGEDRFLHEVLPSIGYDELFASRFLSLLWSSSVLNDSGKDRNQAEVVLTDAVIDAVAKAEPGRFLYIGVVDLDSGRFLQVDMVKLAREVTPVDLRNACYRAIIGASTAIPMLMSPKFVDGKMLADGAIRHHLFAPYQEETVWPKGVRGRLLVVVNQDTGNVDQANCKGRSGETCNGVLPIALRVAALATDQAMRDSLRSVESMARRVPPVDSKRGLETYYVTASSSVNACVKVKEDCESSTNKSAGGYCSAYMRCVANAGFAVGQSTAGSTSPWQAFEELGIGPP